MHEIRIAPSAVRDLDDIREPDLSRLRSRILSLEHDPRPHGSLKLKGFLHRVRVGEWRILGDDFARLVFAIRWCHHFEYIDE